MQRISKCKHAWTCGLEQTNNSRETKSNLDGIFDIDGQMNWLFIILT